MKKALLFIAGSIAVLTSTAQSPEDILRYSYFPVTGSARQMAVGGAMGSLAGDIGTLFMNPAGLAQYRTREFVISPALTFNNNKSNFRGTNGGTDVNGGMLGTSGFVFGFGDKYGKNRSQAFSIGMNQTASFKNDIHYKGQNNFSSRTEAFAEEIIYSGKTIDGILNDPAYAYGTAPALYTYLVDTFRNASNQLVVRGLPEFLLENGIALDQEKRIETSGGIYELGLGYAINTNEKLFYGATLGIPIVSYKRNSFYRESDPSGITNNNFDFFELRDELTTFGVGANIKLGVLYKPQEYFRLGFTVHTPTWYQLTDKQSASINVNSEGYNGSTSVNSSVFTKGEKQGVTKYMASTPWKAIVSASYVFRELEDTRRQRAFLTADIEYVGYSSGRFSADEETASDSDFVYYDQLKEVIKDQYKGAFNFRLGGEIKFNTIMFRAGGAYYMNPYRDSELRSNIAQLSAGIGYRDKGIFIDLTYVHTMRKEVDFPYRLTDRANTFADLNNTRGNVMLTLGFKL